MNHLSHDAYGDLRRGFSPDGQADALARHHLVFEDGQAGIEGAEAAGMKTVWVPRSSTPVPTAGGTRK